MSVPGKRTIGYGRKAYLQYLRSEAWRRVKARYLRSNLPKCCYICGAPWREGFAFHHKTHKNLGNERLMDIGPICPDCNEALRWGRRVRRNNLCEAPKRNAVRKTGGLE